MLEEKNLFEIRDLTKVFPLSKKRSLTAVNHVSFNIYEGEKFGVVGESGCGKSTLGRVILQLHKATSGKVIYHGKTSDEVSPRYLIEENLRKYQSEAAALYRKALEEPSAEKAQALKDEANARLEAGAEFAGDLALSDKHDARRDLLELVEQMRRKQHAGPRRRGLFDAPAQKEDAVGV